MTSILRTFQKKQANSWVLLDLNTKNFYEFFVSLMNYSKDHPFVLFIDEYSFLRSYDVKIGKTYKGEIDFVVMKDGKKCFVQVAYLLSREEVIEREFGVFDPVRDHSPKYVLSLDEYDMSKDGIIHLNIENWLLGKVDFLLS